MENKQCGRVRRHICNCKGVSTQDVIWPAIRMDRRRRWNKKCVIKVGHLHLEKKSSSSVTWFEGLCENCLWLDIIVTSSFCFARFQCPGEKKLLSSTCHALTAINWNTHGTPQKKSAKLRRNEVSWQIFPRQKAKAERAQYRTVRRLFP